MEGMFTGAEVLSVEEGNGWRPPPLNSGGKEGCVVGGGWLFAGGAGVALSIYLSKVCDVV